MPETDSRETVERFLKAARERDHAAPEAFIAAIRGMQAWSEGRALRKDLNDWRPAQVDLSLPPTLRLRIPRGEVGFEGRRIVVSRGTVEFLLARHLPALVDVLVRRTVEGRLDSGAFDEAPLAAGMLSRHRGMRTAGRR